MGKTFLDAGEHYAMHIDTRQEIAHANYYITEHFRYTDLICPCCDIVKLTPGVFRHIELLEELRRRAGFEFIITSGYRCPPHNREVGGAPKSWHLLFRHRHRTGGRRPGEAERDGNLGAGTALWGHRAI